MGFHSSGEFACEGFLQEGLSEVVEGLESRTNTALSSDLKSRICSKRT